MKLAMLFVLPFAVACTSSSDTTTASDSTASDLTQALQSLSGGVLGCAPTAEQIAACASAAAGDACTLAVGSASADGTCRASITGEVGCAPNPPAPPAEAIAACDGKASGDTCVVDDDGDTGVCKTAADGTTVACHRVFSPPQAAVDACASLASGDACTMTGRNGETHDGTCETAPDASSTVLACRPAGHFADAAAACANLAAGDSCTLAAGREQATGTCTDDGAGSVLCVMSCGGHEGCGPGGHHGGGGRR